MKRKIMAALVALALVPTVALAGGSDSPTPYTVDERGITLPEGRTFQDHGHINLRTNAEHRNIHFEGKCIDRTDAECAGNRHADAQFIGESFIPWSAFGLDGEFCVEWVQISDFNEHFGEGGQKPVCVGKTLDPEPTPTPTPEPTPEPTGEPTPTPEPTEEPQPTPTPPIEPTPEPTPTPIPSETPEPEPSVTPDPEEPTWGASSTYYEKPVLAQTGTATSIVVAVIALLLIAGSGLAIHARRGA